MSTNLIISIVLAALVVGGGGYYVATSGALSMDTTQEDSRVGDFNQDGLPDSDQSDTGADLDVEVQGKLSTGAFVGSWNDLVTRGGNYKCEINHSSSREVTGGTVYVNGANVRGDFASVVDGANVQSHMLKVGNTMYIWSSAMPQGIKMEVSAMAGNSQGTAQGGGVSADHSYDWNCSATGVSSSNFEIPSGIEFMDLSTMMQGSGGFKMPSY